MTNNIKSVGLLSTQFTINYGATLQAYSLFNRLQKIDGVQVTAIDYSPQAARYGHFESYNFKGPKNTILSMLKLVNWGYRKSRNQKKRYFQQFVENEFSLTENTYYSNSELISANFKYDLVIVGSDQVWNPNVINDSSFYLDFIDSNSTVKASYAASLGGELSEFELNNLISHLSDFERISLREPIQLDKLQSRLGKAVDVLVDPVFLTGKEEWMELAEKSTMNLTEPFLLIYEVNSPPNFKEYVDFLKDNTKLKIIEISTRPFSKYSNVQTISNAGPYDFLKLFSKAEYILTSSFHGVAFSSILNKNFSCVLNSERSTRQRNVLSELGIKSCEVSTVNELSTNLNKIIEWEIVNENILRLQELSNKYISELIKHDS